MWLRFDEHRPPTGTKILVWDPAWDEPHIDAVECFLEDGRAVWKDPRTFTVPTHWMPLPPPPEAPTHP